MIGSGSESHINITLVQFPVSFGKIDDNFNLVTEKLEKFNNRNLIEPNLILLPELFATGYDLNVIRLNAENIKKNRQLEFLSSISEAYNSYIYTSIPEKDKQDNIFNTAVLISNKGKLLQTYRKIHLFIPLGELDVFNPGSKVAIYKSPVGTFGLSICYDLRFPELYVQQRNLGMNINLICAEWPITRIDHWVTMLQSRAIENQTFVCAINRVGTDETGTYGGNSMVIAPDGTILAKLNQEETVHTVKLDLNLLTDSRKIFNIQKEKKLS